MIKFFKYTFFGVLALFLFVFHGGSTVLASVGTTTPTLTIGSAITTKNSHISVPIMASDFKNSVAGMDLLINYDPTLLTINSITPNTTLGGALFNKNYASNLIYISYLAENDTNFNLNSGVIAILNFTVISGSNTNANLTFKTTSPGLRSKLYDKYGSNKPANFASGLLTIAPLPIPTLSSISIVHPTNKLSYIVGDLLDISGLEVVGHYTDNSLAVLPITTANISGFNSSFPAITQILTIVFSGKTTTYAVAINPLIITTPTLTIGSIITTNGSHISVPIMASDFTNSIAGMDLLINYDPTLLTIDSITPTTTLGGALFNKNYAPNLMYVSYLAENDTNFNLNSGVIAILNFTVISGSNTTANLIFKTTAPGIRSKLYDKYGSNMSGNFMMGTVTIHPVIPPIVQTVKAGFNSGITSTITPIESISKHKNADVSEMPLSTKIDLIDSPFSPSVPIIENTDDVKNIIKNQEINFSAPSIESLIPSTLGIIPSQVLVSEIPKYLLESSYVDVQPLPDLCVADSE